jgi:hypothetical protein
MSVFFFKNWWLYYLLFFLLSGLFVYALLWDPKSAGKNAAIQSLNQQLDSCRKHASRIDSALLDCTERMKVDNLVFCDAAVKSGAQGITTTQHELGARSGWVIIKYDMLTVPDNIKVYYDDIIVAQSNGFVSGTGNIQFKYHAVPGKPSFCIVSISAPDEDTQWEYRLNCPQ